jgi:hypothetical protein
LIGVDPIAARDSVVATDADESFRRIVVEAWAFMPGGAEGLSVRDAVRSALTQEELAGFREALQERFGGRRLAADLGNYLRKLEGCVVGGRMLVKAGRDDVQNVARWAVRPSDEHRSEREAAAPRPKKGGE